MNSVAKFLCLWQPKFSSKNKLMIAQLIKQLPIKNKKNKTYQATRSNSKRYNQLEKKMT